jgi:anti-sigma-K factor RskA
MSDVTASVTEDDLLAAELALGVLAGAERMAAQNRVTHDPLFASMVTSWEVRLAPWIAEISEVPAPPHVWEGIVAALPDGKRNVGFWQSLAFWRGLSLATGALAAACIGALIYLGNAPHIAPLTAGIDGDGRRQFVATVDTRTGNIAVVPAAYNTDATREPELWLIPADGRPRPLGMLRADRAVTINMPAELAALTVGNAVLAVSLEPPGGSTTGSPTGPVVATGKLTNL